MVSRFLSLFVIVIRRRGFILAAGRAGSEWGLYERALIVRYIGLSRRGISRRQWRDLDLPLESGLPVEFRLWSGWCLVNWIRVNCLGLSPLDRGW